MVKEEWPYIQFAKDGPSLCLLSWYNNQYHLGSFSSVLVWPLQIGNHWNVYKLSLKKWVKGGGLLTQSRKLGGPDPRHWSWWQRRAHSTHFPFSFRSSTPTSSGRISPLLLEGVPVNQKAEGSLLSPSQAVTLDMWAMGHSLLEYCPLSRMMRKVGWKLGDHSV